MSIFRVSHIDSESRARRGVLSLPHGTVQTPAFMPVGTNATVKSMTHRDLEDIGFQLILGNTYHLYLRPGVEVIKSAGGLHSFTTWPKNILTDSGGYQVFSLSELRKLHDDGVRFQSHIDGSYHEFTPEKVMDLQAAFGSDIAMPLDVCTPPGIERSEAAKAVDTTTRWLKRSRDRWLQYGDTWFGSLFGIIQGNFYADLRRKSICDVLELDLPGVAIGGLSVGEPWEEFCKFLEISARDLPQDIPHYVMGIGTPDYIFEAVAHGIDIFDCVYPTRTARTGLVFTSNGMISLKKEYNASLMEPIDSTCTCTTCSRYTRAYLRHLFKAKEILGIMLATYHNLFFLESLMDRIRQSIRNGTFSRFKTSFLESYQNGKKVNEGRD